MKLVFPFKNLELNSLIGFFEKVNTKQFIDLKEEKDHFGGQFFYDDVDRFRNRLPDFENEILQIISTTNQETIDFYFNELGENYSHLKELLSMEKFTQQIGEWNDEALLEYEELVERNTNDYFKKEEREKYEHLEEYDSIESTSTLS